jgi:signal transduction histidine kinase
MRLLSRALQFLGRRSDGRPDGQRSLTVLALLSVLVPLFVYGALGIFRYQEASQGTELRVSRSLRVAHEHANSVVKSAEALNDRIFDLVNGRSPEELRQRSAALREVFLAKLRDERQVQSIWIIGADGKAIVTTLAATPPNLDFSDREYFQHHQRGQAGRYLSPPFTSRTTGERILDISARFNGPDGNFGGVINVSLRTSYFEEFQSNLINDEPGLALNLFHEDGPIYARWPKLANAPDRLGPNSPTLQLVKAGKTSATVRGVSSVDNRNRLVSFAKLEGYPLYVGAGIDLSTVRAAVMREFAVLLALGLPPFAAIFFAARIAIRRAQESYLAAERLNAETITRRKAEEALLQAQKLEALGRLTGGVAHDFNNALMVISNNAFLLHRETTPAGAERLASIKRAVDSATKLTRQLLAFSRRQALIPERVDLRAKLPATGALLAPVLGGQIALSIEVAPDVHPILVDMAELELSLLNLAINARDAMPAGGAFTIRARNLEAGTDDPSKRLPMVLIEVSDSGSGIPPEVLARVFEPFFTTKPVGEGTGLGLSQVYGFCERAGGQASIRSELGVGTTVSLRFPAATGVVDPGEAVREAVPRNLGKFVLVVEDNDEVAGALTLLLEALGCRCARVKGGEAALDWLAVQAQPVDLVLSDVVMPGAFDGLGLALRLRDLYPKQRVVLMTGYAEKMDRIETLGFEVIPKPCSPEVLAAAIAGR